MTKRILVINAGSSSLKFAAYAADREPRLELKGQLSGIGQGEARLAVADAGGRALDWGKADALGHHSDALKLLIARLEIAARPQDWLGAGHRVVHGGTRFSTPVRVDGTILKELASLIPLAPLHQPHNVAPIEALQTLLPTCPRSRASTRLSMPPSRRSPPASRCRRNSGKPACGAMASMDCPTKRSCMPCPASPAAFRSRLVIAHLGNGASMAAIRDGKCVATTMGFSTLDGLVMGTRPGAIDPGVLLHLLRDGMSREELERLLYHESGVKGVSGLTADMKTLLESADPKAKLAIDLYCYRIARELGSLAAALGGLDALVFTGGVGENATAIRARVCADAAWLGLQLDDDANRRGGPRISTAASPVAAWIVPTDEELTIARHTQRLLARA